MRTIMAGLGLLLMAAPAGAQTVQQRFDAALARVDAKDGAGALAELDSLDAFLRAQPVPSETNLAVTRALRGEALIQLGRMDEARAAIDAALAGPWLKKPALAAMLDRARLLRGDLHEVALEHAEADRLFLEVARTTAAPMTRAVALIGAARNQMFVDAPGALARVEEALALAEQDPMVGKAQLAAVLGLKGRILLNAGRAAEAKPLLVRAVDLRGGLTARTDLADASLRADAAVAMLRLGSDESARRYLAFSGAGHSKAPLAPPVDSPLPACGADEDLRPDDMAIIEFTLNDDGTVAGPRPIFASRQGEMAYLFARAVADWSWEPVNAAKVSPFFRASLRVELRCSRKAERPSLLSPFGDASRDWLESQGASLEIDGAEAEIAAAAERKLAELPAADRSARRLALLAILASNPTVPQKRQRALADEAVALARALQAPGAVRFRLAVLHAELQLDRKLSSRAQAPRRIEQLQALSASPEFADPRIQATIQTLIADNLMRIRRNAEAIAALRPVTEGLALPAGDPLLVAALLALANAHAAEQDLAAATRAYERTGLSARQCALLDAGPVITKGGSGNYPADAADWGFEGWTVLEYDVATDGRTQRARTVAAFPPALFNGATEKAAETVRYAPSYRPDGELACTALQRRVKFSYGR